MKICVDPRLWFMALTPEQEEKFFLIKKKTSYNLLSAALIKTVIQGDKGILLDVKLFI